jgi:SanA protein
MILSTLLGLLLLAVVSVLLINWSMQRSAAGRIYRDVGSAPARDVALVLGARVYSDGRLSAMLEDRVRSAAALYKAGKVKKLLMSGDNSTRTYDEVTAMRRAAIQLGVPSDDVVRDFAGFRTYDSIYRARDLWDIRSMVIVTQEFHLARSLCIARALGVDAVGYTADRRAYYGPSMARAKSREMLARVSAWIDLHLMRPKPHFLGPKESLSGDTQEATTNNPTFPRTAGRQG